RAVSGSSSNTQIAISIVRNMGQASPGLWKTESRWEPRLHGGEEQGLPVSPGYWRIAGLVAHGWNITHMGKAPVTAYSPPPPPPPPPPVDGCATASARLLACRLPVPEDTFTPMLPEAAENALPDRLAVLVASTAIQSRSITWPLRLAVRSAVPISEKLRLPFSSVSHAIPPTPCLFGLATAPWVSKSQSECPVW